ncbi:hypothetical protein HYQ44_017028 [Verticillium longisporum]|nr:hypothetical protein HYQ44_017028 [Verticillium longisporum]
MPANRNSHNWPLATDTRRPRQLHRDFAIHHFIIPQNFGVGPNLFVERRLPEVSKIRSVKVNDRQPPAWAPRTKWQN